ncbi:hypothetical protein SDC9_210100 [bioreactor metagenome]|uniref:Uncharacterized protein n=1 Tax=bioreactor metagenome TaxID=1076179 RepID=A0A645JSK7_9ZZZZ
MGAMPIFAKRIVGDNDGWLILSNDVNEVSRDLAFVPIAQGVLLIAGIHG